VAGSSLSPRRAGVAAGLLAAGLLLAACTPETPQPPPSSSAGPPTSPASPEPSLPPIEGSSVHFTAQGDTGVGSGARKVLDVIAQIKPQMNLALGDYTYKAGIEQQFCDLVTEKLGAGFPYEVVTGNHESDGHEGDIANIVKCLPNRLPGLQGEYGTQWYVAVPEKNPVVRIVMVSPGIDFRGGKPLDYSRGSERWRWTADALDGAKARNIPWTVVGMHAPCFSLGNYGCQPGEEFTNMLIEKKVDLVLSGHDHVYQRTHQLGLSGGCPGLVPASFSAQCLADTDNTMVQGAGTVFVGVGIGGIGHYNVHDDDPEVGYFASWSGKNRNATLGTLDVTAGQDSLTARLVPAEGYSHTDAFEIRRK